MNPETLSSWQLWAVLSAVFAALTAIFAKVGVEGINSDLATLIRTVIVLITLSLILFATGQLSSPGAIVRTAGGERQCESERHCTLNAAVATNDRCKGHGKLLVPTAWRSCSSASRYEASAWR